jgi:Xaa-Pro dipeptidase
MNLKSIIDRMHQEEIDSLLILKPENITYLSGYKPSSMSFILIKEDAVLYTSKMDRENAATKSHIALDEFKTFDEIKKELKGKVGVENSMPVSVYKKFCNDHETALTEIIESSRMIKSPDEIKNIQKSIEIAEESLLKLDFQGTESEIAADLEYNMKFNGSLNPAFDTIIASGKRSSLPHATISTNKLETPTVIDWGAIYNNYCSDITRTLIESEKEKEIFNIVMEAQKEAIKVIKPGIKASYVDKVARNVIDEYGYGENFIHSTGHGIGLEVHENPPISENSGFKIQKGMVITIEPGIYIKEKFGVRIEDDIQIKNRGKVLTSIKKVINF